jgi:lipoprotein-releasing system ATP-binding protein
MNNPIHDPLLEVTHLTKTFGTDETATRVLKGLNLTVQRGGMIALLGVSGSGKSTLLNILGTLLRPTSGSFKMLGQDLFGADDAMLTDFRNRHIGFVFQFHNLLPDFTALENVIFPSAVRDGTETQSARKRGADLLDIVGLSDRKDFRATKLSGGQKQRVAMARALMNQPDLILADEPTGNLDSKSAEQVMSLIKEINEREQTTFIISTHAEGIANQCESRVVIKDGRI